MQTIRDVIGGVLASLKTPENLRRCEILERWPAIVGPEIARHTRPRLDGRGSLKIWVEQSALAFELNQKYRQTILKRVRALFGEKAVKDVRVFVGQLRT